MAMASRMMTMTTTSWRELGRCKDEDPDVFYPEDDEDPGEEAKAIYAMCMVRETCLESAIATREKLGVWVERPPANAGASSVSAAERPDRLGPNTVRLRT